MAHTEHAPVTEKGSTQVAATAVAEPAVTTPDAPRIMTVDQDLLAELVRAQQRTADMLAGFLHAQKKHPVEPVTYIDPQAYPTARPVIQGDMPPGYAIWLGPDPPPGGEICFRARGRVQVIMDRETPYKMIDGDGRGKEQIVKGTTVKFRTTDYVDQGYTSVEFTRRCPPNHKYAGRLFADIECAEHAAYLHLSAPNGRGGDTSNNPLFRFHLPPSWVEKYKYLKDTRFASRKSEQSDVEWVMQGGSEMPQE